jgi:putative DNA primase/helicase
MSKKQNAFDKNGGDIKKEIAQYPLDKMDLLTTTNGSGAKVYNRCTENIFRILNAHPDFKGRFRFDKWTHKQEILKEKKWDEVADSDYIPIQRKISSMYPQFIMLGKEMVIDAVGEACRDNSFDRAEDYIRKIKWDKKDRLKNWLTYAYGVKDEPYHKAVGENFFKGMVKRVIQPGCKFDTVMILEGKQGCGKSTSLTIIGRAWHLETTMVANKTDFFLQFRGKLIVEFSEGETLSRTETKNMKAMISTPTDTYREPYGRTMRDVPRRCIFAMTTNQDEYLKDESGNRRFYPVEVVSEKVDLKWIKENRDQLFAEALHRVETLKETVWEYPKEAEDRQREKMVRSPYEEAIRNWLEAPFVGKTEVANINRDGLTALEVWQYALKGDAVKMRRAEEMQVTLGLRQIGFEKERRMINRKRETRWVKVKKKQKGMAKGGKGMAGVL